MAEESVLLKVGIDENQIARSEAAIISARESIDKLKEANKELAAEGKKNTVEYVKNETALKGLNTTVRENQRILNASTKIQTAAKGSIAELRANVSRLKQEYVDLSEEERNNIKVGGALQKSLLAQTNELKKLEGEIGVTSRNVGNYSDSIIEAADSTGLFTQAQQALAVVQKVATAATQGGTIATKSFGAALTATGIGAIVVVLGSLISYLTRTQEGMDFVAKATEAVGTFAAVVLDAFTDLGAQIVENFIPAFQGLKDIVVGFFTLDAEQLRKGLDGVGEAVGNIDGINIIEVAGNAASAAKEAARLEGELQNIVRAEKDLALETAQSRAQLEELKKAGDDITKSTAERSAALEKATALELGLEAKRIALQSERVAILKAQNELTISTDADRNKVIEAEIELANIQQESGTKQIELQNKLNGLNKEAAARTEAEAKALQAAQDTREAEAIKAAADRQKELNANYTEAIKQRAEETDAAIRDSINSVRSQFAEGLIDLETYQEQLDQVEALAVETRKAALLDQLEVTRTNAELDAETRLAIERNLQDQLRAIKDEELSAGVAVRAEELAAAAKLAEDKKALAVQTSQARIAAEDAVLNAAKNIFGEQSAAGKIAASFQALIDTYRGANLALATIPPPFGQIIAGVTVAQGLANVSKINSKAAPKFEEGGGIEVSGPSHAGGGVDLALGGQTVANVEGGEGLFVMKKSAYKSLQALSTFNQMHGGRSWTSGTSRHLADGGAVARSSVPSLDRRALTDSQQSFENALSKIQIVTRVTDIDRVQSEAKAVQVQADLI